MRSVALRSLVHERGKAAASLVGVACASALLFVEAGLYSGLRDTSSALIRRAGGDIWIVSHGTEVLDNGQPVSATVAERLRAVPCVSRVRELVLSMLPVKKKSGAQDYVQLVGVDPLAQPPLPWSWGRGEASVLANSHVSVDDADTTKLGLSTAPIGATLHVAGSTLSIAATTHGIRSFALVPYVFADLKTAREVTAMGDGGSTYLIADTRASTCKAEIRAALNDGTEVDVRTTLELAEMTESYWMDGSGAGATLAASALFSVIVGAVTVGQTLYSITRDHLRELGTLKAMGATTLETVLFVFWQTGTIAGAGGVMGLALAFAIRRVVESAGITMSLAPRVLGMAGSAVLTMCVLAALPSILRVRRVSPLEVLR
jgi:putative ABC transport system permease protein